MITQLRNAGLKSSSSWIRSSKSVLLQSGARRSYILSSGAAAASCHLPNTTTNVEKASNTPYYYHFGESSQLARRFSSDSTSTSSSAAGGLLEYETIHELQRNACEAYRDKELFGTYDPESNAFKWMTYGEFDSKVAQCRGVLKDLGVTQYSKVGLISNNRWEWAALTTAAYSLNATAVPMYEAQTPSDWQYILNDSECVALFCANESIYDRLRLEVLPSTPSVQSTLCLDFDDEHYAEHALATHMQRHEGIDTNHLITPPLPHDLGNLIYTSGTTGKPKGVELMHSNTISNAKAVPTMTDLPEGLVWPSDRSLAFLPWAHSYGQTCELWTFISFGASMGICRGVPTILDDLQLVQPTVLFSVPTLYKKVYDGVSNLIEQSSPMKQRLMRRAFHLGNKNRNAGLGLMERMQFNLLDSIVLDKVRDRFGGNMRMGFCAGAAVPREVLDFMDDIGIQICEGYGLTETSPIITLNSLDYRRVGSVGRPITGVNVTIVGPEGQILPQGEEGEICCHGPNIMRGYYKNQQATDEVMSVAPDGSRMFHTGDLGCLTAEGYVTVTGRIKEQYKLENGKYVCPTPIEEAIGMSRFITQIVLCGANRPHNVALLVPDWAAICHELNLSEEQPEQELVNHEAVKNLLDQEIHMCAAGKLKKFEIPQSWAVVAPFTAVNNMLTPKMSIRRHAVIKTYEDVISNLYDEANGIGGQDESVA